MTTQVKHTQFGIGTILSQDENNVTVDFNGNVKTLIIRFARLENMDGTSFGVMASVEKPKSKKRNPANFDKSLPSWKGMTSEDKYKFQLERESDMRNSKSNF
jgi:hypothetical protein